MSLDTLLEAAEYIEWSAHSKPRDDDGSPGGEIRTFIKTETLADGDSSLDDSIGSQRGYGYADDRKDRRRAGGAGTRETHNKLEKNRRAHLKECFDILKVQIPFMEDKKTSNLSILRGALKFIQNMKRKEKEFDRELHRLVSEKSRLRERLEKLKVDLAKLNMDVDLTKWMPTQEQETNSTSTASGDGSPIVSDNDEDNDKRPTNKKLKHSSKDKGPSTLTQMILNTSVQMIQPQPTISTSKKFSHIKGTSVTPTMPTHIRAPVTQLLHQTLSKRQALQRQREQLAVSQVNTMNLGIPSAAQMNPLLQQQLAFPIGTTPLSSGNILTPTMSIPTSTTGLQTPMLLTTSTTTSASSTYNHISTATVTSSRFVPSATSLPGITNVPNLSAIGPISALTGMSRTSTSLPIIGQPPTASIGQPIPLKTTQLITTIVTPSVTSLASMSAIKPILATTNAHFMTLNPLLAQFPRNNTLLTGMTSQAGTTPQPQLVSYAHMGMGTLTPMTMMPQGLQMAGFGNIMSSHQLLKQFPILQQPLLQQMQQGQVIGQPMVKPVVMVSLPSAVTSATSTLPLNIATTS
ncbi:max-binding protein MNT isoform X1 [Patella vulgata]|uniref:max-binding protein MNT isoform X1 n=1 Tax=Patella vulgata TaxID=6465 RepID=UPI00217F51AE|nr:max-binding protein MNT isoform X1 [Patella vulgata]